MKKSVYIHVPFCSNICHYCDFNKFFIQNQPVDAYLDAMAKEIALSDITMPKTIFIGGGTPSALSEEQLEKLLRIVRQKFLDIEGIEWTIEANPGDLTEEKLSIMKEFGVNRLSLGVQTFHDEHLKAIGRSHRAVDVYQTIEAARKTGIDNISIDLIYGLPDQTITQLNKDLISAIDLQVQHISAYSLIIEPKTVFYQMERRGQLNLPTNEIEAEMYELVMDKLSSEGYEQYEISNYAKKGFESQHNLTYWKNEEYAGFGTGAHGYENGVRYANVNVLKKYINSLEQNQLPRMTDNKLSKKEQMEEMMFLGLRLSEGVSYSLFEEKYNERLGDVFPDALEINLGKGLLAIENKQLKLTRAGKLLGNEVFQSFLLS